MSSYVNFTDLICLLILLVRFLSLSQAISSSRSYISIYLYKKNVNYKKIVFNQIQILKFERHIKMQIRLSSAAEGKQKKLLQEQEKNDLIKTQLKYTQKILAQLNQKLHSQKETCQLHQEKKQKQTNKTNQITKERNVLQQLLVEKRQINQELLSSVKQKKELLQKMSFEDQKNRVTIQKNEQKLQLLNICNEQQSRMFQKCQYTIDANQIKKKELGIKVQNLMRQINKIEKVLEQFKVNTK